MRKFMKSSLILLMSLLVVMQAAAFTVSAESFPCVGIVVADDVNVRTGPSTDYDIIASVWYGVTLDVYAREGNWFKIGTGNGTAQTMSVFARRTLRTAAAILPATASWQWQSDIWVLRMFTAVPARAASTAPASHPMCTVSLATALTAPRTHSSLTAWPFPETNCAPAIWSCSNAQAVRLCIT